MSRLKTWWIVVANVALMGAVLLFVALYSGYERQENYRSQVEHFVNSSIAMERVTGNYLEGEQGICDNWAKYINSRDLTLEEAAAYIQATHAKAAMSAHLIDTESLTGFSTRPKVTGKDDYSVSYARIDLFGNGSWIADVGQAINVTRTYTNPMNGEQSLAFCNRIAVRDPESGEKRPAYLLRVVPVSNLEEKWVFPKEEYGDEEFSIIDRDGKMQRFSKTYGEKSGGETQTPYYVAIAASFAQMYSGRETVRILMLDEAFNNMDEDHIESMMQFFRAQNFQVILAAPPSRMETIGEYVDSIFLAIHKGRVSTIEEYYL